MKATLIQTNGQHTQIEPLNGKTFTLKEMQAYVKGLVEIVPLPDDKSILICNEEGKLDGLPVNVAATEYWKKMYPISKYPINNDELVVGDVMVCDSAMVE